MLRIYHELSASPIFEHAASLIRRKGGGIAEEELVNAIPVRVRFGQGVYKCKHNCPIV